MIPRVSVIMPVYNAEKYLKESIESVLNQSFTDFEFIIINDGSTDCSREIILGYDDSRIKFVENEANMGIAETMNKGINLAQGELIARMDADDICLLEKLEKQVEFMSQNQHIGILGGWTKTFGYGGEFICKYPVEDDRIRCELLFLNTFANPTIMIRKKIYLDNDLFYNKTFVPSEDYELFSRAFEYTSFANIPEVLLLYRMHESNITKTINQDYHLQNVLKTREFQLKKLGIQPTEEELLLHRSIPLLEFKPSSEYLKKINLWLCLLKKANEQKRIYDQKTFEQVLGEKWFRACKFSAKKMGVRAFLIFLASPLIFPLIKNWRYNIRKYFDKHTD